MHHQHDASARNDRANPQETTPMTVRRIRLFLLLLPLAAAILGASAGAQDGRGVPVIGGPATEDCESCRASRRPPWHSSAVAGRGYPVGQGAMSAGPCPTGRCGPVDECRSCGPRGCRACGLSGVCGLTGACHPPLAAGCWGHPYPLPPCLPRLSAYLREGRLVSPQPLVIPRCHECGAYIEGGV